MCTESAHRYHCLISAEQTTGKAGGSLFCVGEDDKGEEEDKDNDAPKDLLPVFSPEQRSVLSSVSSFDLLPQGDPQFFSDLRTVLISVQGNESIDQVQPFFFGEICF